MNAGTGEVAKLANDAQSLLANLVVETTPDRNGCASASTFADVVARAAASEQAKVNAAISTPVIGEVVDAGGSLFATVTADEIAQVKAHALAAVGCQASNPGDSQQGAPAGGGSSSNAGNGSNSNAAGGSNSNAGNGSNSSAGTGGKGSGGGYEAGAGIGPVSLLVKLGL